LKDQPIKAARVTHLVNIGDDADEILLTVAEVKTTGATTHWLLPLAVLWEDQPSAVLANMLAVARVRRGSRVGLLTDAFALPSFAHRFLSCLASGKEFTSDDGVLRFQPTEAGRDRLEGSLKAEVNMLAAEQSNSLLTIGDVAMLKMYRRISDWPTGRASAELDCIRSLPGGRRAPEPRRKATRENAQLRRVAARTSLLISPQWSAPASAVSMGGKSSNMRKSRTRAKRRRRTSRFSADSLFYISIAMTWNKGEREPPVRRSSR
jgi:maltose alpha-D-glucosyltransferase/alpha-amylase